LALGLEKEDFDFGGSIISSCAIIFYQMVGVRRRMNIQIVVVLGHAVFETHYNLVVSIVMDGIIGMSMMSGNEHWQNYRNPGLFSACSYFVLPIMTRTVS
jgi:hypothetical protein